MKLLRVFYSQANIVDVNMNFVCYTTIADSREVFPISIPLGVNLKTDRNVIQEDLHEAVSKFLGLTDFFLVPSSHQVEMDAWFESQKYHPELHPMEDDSSIGGLFGSLGREE